ncbi:MAG: cell division protein SepF [Clostridiales Family XIII bacterium]|jgi:cell division inhibitor SepF|nr:cell division protein SepF [Clostridiales Family XIII bacterium]
MAGGLLNKLKALVGIEEMAEYDEEEEWDAAQAERRSVDLKGASYSAPISSRVETHDGSRDRDSKDKVISMQNKTLNAITSQFKLIVTEPKGFDECPRLVDSLKCKKPVIINLEKVESDAARKIFDFLSGATYALNGNVQKIANNIFVFVPENIDVMSNTEHKGIDFSGNAKSPWK